MRLSDATLIHELTERVEQLERTIRALVSDDGYRQIKVEDVAGLAAPENVAATLVSGGILLQWDDVAGAESYTIHESDSLVATSDISSYTHSVSEPREYTYYIQAQDEDQLSEQSVAVSISIAPTSNIPVFIVPDGPLVTGSNTIQVAYPSAATNWRMDFFIGGEIVNNQNPDGVDQGLYLPQDNNPNSYPVTIPETDSIVIRGRFWEAADPYPSDWIEGVNFIAMTVDVVRPINKDICVEWDAVAGVESYDVYLNGSLIDSTTELQYIYTATVSGEYAFHVVAHDDDLPVGSQKSVASLTVSVTL